MWKSKSDVYLYIRRFEQCISSYRRFYVFNASVENFMLNLIEVFNALWKYL